MRTPQKAEACSRTNVVTELHFRGIRHNAANRYKAEQDRFLQTSTCDEKAVNQF